MQLRDIAKQAGRSLGELSIAINRHNDNARADGPAIAATREELVRWARLTDIPIVQLDGHVRFKGKKINDAELLDLVNIERRRAKLPPYCLAENKEAA